VQTAPNVSKDCTAFIFRAQRSMKTSHKDRIYVQVMKVVKLLSECQELGVILMCSRQDVSILAGILAARTQHSIA